MSDPEDKITLETPLDNYGDRVMLIALLAAVAELYQKGAEIGWETKILDPLNEQLRKLV